MVFTGMVPVASSTGIAKAAPDAGSISGTVKVSDVLAWDGFGVKITNNRLGTTAWTTTTGGWYSFPNLNGGDYTISHNHPCASNAPMVLTNVYSSVRADITITCPKHNLEGNVYVNDIPAWDGFGVKAVDKNGRERWAIVSGGNGHYVFHGESALPDGVYSIHHNHNTNCKTNTPYTMGLPAANNRGPDIYIDCPKHTLNGYVYINDMPAWKGFGVKATNQKGESLWAVVENDQGWYEFRDGSSLHDGVYVIDHNYPCPSNVPMTLGIPAANNRGPNIHLNCDRFTLHGRVFINNEPAHIGFGVKASINGWGTKWALVENDEGYYEFKGTNSLIDSSYLIDHNHPCSSNTPTGVKIPAANDQGPNIYLDCPDAKHSLYGYVKVNGSPPWAGFGVAAVRKNGSTKWALTDSTGRYEFTGDSILTEGEYTIRHNHPCPSDTPVVIHIPTTNNRGPDVNLTCEEVKYKLSGYVKINGEPAPLGFGVKATNAKGEIRWAVVENDQGWYEFRDGSALVEGDYTIHHNHPCPSDTPVDIHIPATNNRGPDVNLTCEEAKYKLNGYVKINGEPAHLGFGVKATNSKGEVRWAVVENDQGWYEFRDRSALLEGDYTIHHNHPCPSDTPVDIHIPATNNRGPDVNLTCGSYNLSGTVTVDGKPAWRKFGVKAVGTNGKAYWALVENDEGRYAFSNLPRDIYYVGHVHDCPTEDGNPVTIDLTNDSSVNFNIKCQPSPAPTPTPIPIDPPGGCVGLETREWPMQQYSIKQDFVAYYIVSKATSTLKSNACPDAIFTIGDITTGKLLTFGSQGSYIDVYNDGRIKTNIESITANPKFECGVVWEVITNKEYAYSCETSYGASANLPNLNGNITLNTKIEHEVHVRGDQLALSLAWSISEMTRKVGSINIQLTDPNTVVGIFGLGIIGMILYNMSLKFFVFPIFWGEPSPEPTAIASSLNDELPEEILSALKAAIGEGAVTQGVWSEMEVSREDPSTLKLQAGGFSPTGGVYVLVMEDELSFPNEAPLHKGSYAADTDGHVDLQIPLSAGSEKPLVILIVDLEDFQAQYAQYVNEEIEEIHYRGTAAVLRSDNVTSRLYLPLVER